MDEHRWKNSFREYVVTSTAATFAPEDGSCPPAWLANPRPLREEILRLAGRVKELEPLVFIGEHLFPDLTWKERAAEQLADIHLLRRLNAERDTENALLRRERALLIELEKARTRILASIFETGGGCSSEDVRQVGELLMAVEALHLEASGGVARPEGVPCACVLCRPEGAGLGKEG